MLAGKQTNRSIVVIMLAIVPTAIFYVVSCCYCWTTSNGLPGILPDILTYKTCVYTPPGFSPGCMDNVTVYPGGTATFNCQVRQIYIFLKLINPEKATKIEFQIEFADFVTF